MGMGRIAFGRKGGSDGKLRCSFCQKRLDEVRKLISNVHDSRSYICDECIGVCRFILEHHKTEDDKADAPGTSTDRQRLEEFIEAARGQGASDEFVVSLLREYGWPPRDIYVAFGKKYAALTGVAVPEHRGRAASARDAFLYLLAFCTLGTWATALGSLFFEFIDRSLPDPVMRTNFVESRSRVSGQMACIIVAFPIFFFVTRFIVRQMKSNPDMRESGVRKWLTYIALLFTAGFVIGDLITFLTYFLQGELTARFALRVITVLVLSGSIFAYYLGSLKDRPEDTPVDESE